MSVKQLEDFVITKAYFFRTNFTWVLDVSDIDLESGDEFYSPEITLIRSDIKGCITIIIKVNNDSQISMQHFFMLSRNSTTQFSRIMVSLCNNETYLRSEVLHRPEYIESVYALSKPIGQPVQFSKDVKKFTINCEIKSIQTLTDDVKQIPKVTGSNIIYQKSYKTFYEQQEFCDVSVLVGDGTIQAHKLVLAACSSVFLNMFTTDTKKEISVDMDHQSEDPINMLLDLSDDPSTTLGVFQEFLRFAYNYPDFLENLQNNEDLCISLLVFSDKYEVLELKEICGKFLTKLMTIRNAVKIFILADSHKCPELRESAKSFVKNNANELKNLRELEKMCDHPELIYEIL